MPSAGRSAGCLLVTTCAARDLLLDIWNIEREETWSAFWLICVDCFGLRLGVVEVDWSLMSLHVFSIL
jgi:hypothetical protein